VVYALHVTTDVVREHYPAVALGDHFSFRVDEYGGLHPDLFETPDRGWHIGNNPGVSMLAAIPYALARPIIDRVTATVQARRAARGQTEAPAFNTPRVNSRAFFAKVYPRALDVKLGLAAFVTHFLLMAPSSALGAVLVFYALRWTTLSDRRALWLALLYAFGTPVFFRTGFLNHNLMLGHIAFAGFLALWNPANRVRPSLHTRYFLAGIAGGTAVLFDYSGGVLLLGLFAYGVLKRALDSTPREAMVSGAWYVLGSIPPVLLLWFYQWRAFGNPFLPGQHWMPPVQYIDRGYQGYGGPQLDLLLSLALDHRYGLFAAGPILALALLAPLYARRKGRTLPRLEEWTCLALFLGLWLFFSGNNYTRLQWNTGIRYMTPILPFLFLPAAMVLLRLPRVLMYAVGIGSVVLGWCTAMNREIWRPLGVLEPVARILTGGFELPALTTMSRMPDMFGDVLANGVSPLPVFALASAVIYLIWRAGPANLRDVTGTVGRLRPASFVAGGKESIMKTDYCVDVVIPVLNEAHVLEKSVTTVRAFLAENFPYRWRVVIADNGSKDGTGAIAVALAARYDDVACHQLAIPGRGSALRHAWTHSTADVVCYMDVDLSTELAALPRIVDAILVDGFDLATGSRLMRESRTTRSLKREAISRIYNMFVKAVLFTSFSDAQCGFKAVSRRVVERVVPEVKDGSWFFDTELLVLAEKWGYRIKDVPVLWIEDDDSRVKIMRTAWDDIKGVFRVRRRLWREAISPASRRAALALRRDASLAAASNLERG
jgi:glycosyltransferase involved in cell wall biosynthesis